jgi:hypothetical protein
MTALLILALVVSGNASVREGREGNIAHSGSNTPYLAIPLGPGMKVTLCAARCLTAVSTDAGPSRSSLLAGRIADLDIPRWSYVCGKPASAGIVSRRMASGDRTSVHRFRTTKGAA